MDQIRVIFLGLFVVNLFSLGFSLECPTCLDDECYQEIIPMKHCTKDTILELPDGLAISYDNEIFTAFDCVSLKYTIGSIERRVSQCVIVPIDSDGICSDILDNVPEDILIGECAIRQIEVPIVGTEDPPSPTDDPSSPTDDPSSPTDDPSSPTDDPSSPTDDPSSPTDDPSSPTDDGSSTPTTTTECPECGAAFISLSIMCSLVVLLRFTL